MWTHNVSCHSSEWMEGQCEDSDPRETTAEGSRHTSDTSEQPSAYGDQTSILKEGSEMMEEMDNKKRKETFKMMEEVDNKLRKEMFKMMEEMDNKIREERFKMMEEMDNKIRREIFKTMEEMDNKITENRTLTDPVNTVVHPLDSCNRALPGRVIQIQHQEKEENELKKRIKKLEARNQELLAKAMAMHQHSEDINDPSHLSAVLKRYEMLQVQLWEKVRSSVPWRWTYDRGSYIIRTLFDACEKDIQKRTDDIRKALDIPLGNNTLTEEMMREIRKLFRQTSSQNSSTVYNKIVQEAAILTGIKLENQTENQFLLQCCQIYSLLLLQDPPVKAQWQMNKRYSEHVDKKDIVHWKNPSLLWPIMKRGEEVIVKGVVWDRNDSLGSRRRLT